MWEFLSDAKSQALSLALATLALVLLWRSLRQVKALIRGEQLRGENDAKGISAQLDLICKDGELPPAQANFIRDFVLPRYEEHRIKYLRARIQNAVVSLLGSTISILIIVISSTQIVKNIEQLIELTAGAEAWILLLILEPQELVAVLAGVQGVVQRLGGVEALLIHRATASRLLGEIWEYLGKSQEYEEGYVATFSIFSATTSEIIHTAETQQLQQQSPRAVKRGKAEDGASDAKAKADAVVVAKEEPEPVGEESVS